MLLIFIFVTSRRFVGSLAISAVPLAPPSIFWFGNKKVRKGKKQLAVVKKVLEEQGMSVQDHLGDDDPYLFVKNPTNKKTSFAGVRIYKIGENIAYRIQKEEKTHPYGKSYQLDLEDMFNDFMTGEGYQPQDQSSVTMNCDFKDYCKPYEYDKSYRDIRTKKEDSDDLAVIQEYYGYNNEKAYQALSILSKDQINYIKKQLEQGGIYESSRHSSGS